MTIARAHLVDPDVARWYHCVTRCVRRAFLLGEGGSDRKLWIENRLQELAGLFSIAVGGFAVLDNHLHVLVRLDPQRAEAWSDEEVVRRWGRLFPPRDQARQPLEVSQAWVEGRLKDEGWVATARQRLQSLSWFMEKRRGHALQSQGRIACPLRPTSFRPTDRSSNLIQFHQSSSFLRVLRVSA
ncbi:hypothetical protein V5E97_37595 [Singulisphaera sp. Ch08]|uniref:Transposase IS200-like domain-containing protein n=1 Tax=Singulisphaera sp. Ch08 TaxID=3120278 RepID=A0AAU7CFY9_9BACT